MRHTIFGQPTISNLYMKLHAYKADRNRATMKRQMDKLIQTDLEGALSILTALAAEIGGAASAEVRFHRASRTGRNPNFRFHTDVPLYANNGKSLGNLRLFHHRPPKLKRTQVKVLKFLAKRIVAELELRKRLHGIKRVKTALAEIQRTAGQLAALGEMAGSLAHEISNPLSIIYAKIWSLRQAAENGPLDKLILLDELDRINGTVENIARIIRGLGSVTRSSYHEPMEPIRVSQILTDTIELYQARIKEQGIRLMVDRRYDEWIQCRAPQISRILLSLLNNSIDAVGHIGERWIEVRTEKSDLGIRIMVTDSGLGVPESIRHKIMRPFFTTKGTGLGLGLSTSLDLAKQYGGRLYLDTRFPRTCFTLELPALAKQKAA
jgi:C4-dicarboxylate-specific signal transduction histidine kinase